MAHTKPSARSRSVPPPRADDEWDLKAAYYRPAQRAADEAWRNALSGLVFSHIELSLQRVRRARRTLCWLGELGTAVSLLTWGGLALLSVQTAFAANPGSAIHQVVPAAMLTVPALAFFGSQRRVSAWLSSREQELRNQELTYLACATALAESKAEVFEHVVEAVLKQSAAQR